MERLVLSLRHGYAVMGLNGPNSVSMQPFRTKSRGIVRVRFTSPIYGTASRIDDLSRFTLFALLPFLCSSDRTVGVT